MSGWQGHAPLHHAGTRAEIELAWEELDKAGIPASGSLATRTILAARTFKRFKDRFDGGMREGVDMRPYMKTAMACLTARHGGDIAQLTDMMANADDMLALSLACMELCHAVLHAAVKFPHMDTEELLKVLGEGMARQYG